MALYIADSNFFIQAHRMYYPLDIMPSFWEQVKELADIGQLISIDKVKNEIVRNKDDLTDWCEANLNDTFFQDSQTVIQKYIEVVQWADSRRDHYKAAALDVFLSADEADAWLVAYAAIDPDGRILVTHETSQPERKNIIKIPDACTPFGVRYVNTIELFRRLNVRF